MWENKYEQKWCLFGGTARLHTKTGLVRTVRIQRFTIRNVKKKKKKNSPWINQLCSVLRTQCSSQETRISKANRSHFSTEVSLAVTVIGVTLKILTVRTCCIGLEKKKKLHVNFSEMGSGKNQCWLKLKSYNSSSTVLCRLHFANTQERAWGSDP